LLRGFLNQPDLHILALDLGLAGLEPLGGIEGDRDLRAFSVRAAPPAIRRLRLPQRHEPNQRKTPPVGLDGCGGTSGKPASDEC
jgi:hypothetical protein